MTVLTAGVHGVGLLGPGIADWAGGSAILSGAARYDRQPTVLAPPSVLPPAERRRVGRTVRIALAVGLEATQTAAVTPATLPSIFAASGGDGENCDEICRVLASEDRRLSPTRFHNSVHNAPAGYWSIAHSATVPSTSVAGYDGSFGVGLLEALTQVAVEQHPALLIAYDTDYPEPMRAKRPIPDAFGVALVLAPPGMAGALARISVEVTDSPADRLDEMELEDLRISIPAARCLPLLRQLARRATACVTLEYLEPLRLAIEVTCDVG
jgi:hypothetical protein